MEVKTTIVLVALSVACGLLPGHECMDTGNHSFTRLPPPECFEEPMRVGTLEWEDSPASDEVHVIWGFGNETCSTAVDCFGEQYGGDQLLPAQIKPVQVQLGTTLRFSASEQMDARFMIQPYEVSFAQFEACDTSNGTALSMNFTNDTILVPALAAGRHYFITHTTDNLYKCEFGLRLMVVVKDNACSGVRQPTPCWGNGRCVTTPLQNDYRCACCHGFAGNYCDYQDGCYHNPCLHNATCYGLGEDDNGPILKCMCTEGYHGDRCEIEVENLCEIHRCDHGGTCIGNRTLYGCECSHGYTGHHCEINVDDCADEPCGSGICVDIVGGYKCFCTPGFAGARCDIALDLCTSNPCKNHGVCIEDEDQGYSCQCPQGYKGADCSIKRELCNPSPCVHAEECVDLGHSYTCTCLAGYAGSHCEVNTNECESDPCHNGGKCIDMVAGYRCVCPHGVHGPNCQFMSHRLYQPDPETEYESRSPWKHRTRLQNLILVAGTLGGAVFLAMMVVGLCYCKVNETYKTIPLWIRAKGYKRYINENGRKSIRRASSTLGSRPSIDAIMEATSTAYDENSLNRPIEASLKARRV